MAFHVIMYLVFLCMLLHFGLGVANGLGEGPGENISVGLKGPILQYLCHCHKTLIK